MKFSKILLAGLLIIALAIVAAFTLGKSLLKDTVISSIDATEVEITAPHTKVYAENGTLLYEIEATHMRKKFQSDVLTFNKPQLHYFPAPNLWVITADYGQASQGGHPDFNRFSLFENVQAALKTPYNQTQLFTTQLHYLPLEHVIHSDKEVTVQNSHYKIQGTGLHVNLEQGFVTFNERTHGRYYVPETASR